METLTFNGILSSDFGIYVIGNNDATAPEFDYESIAVPGATRDIHDSNRRLKNKDVIYHCVCFNNADTAIPGFISALMASNMYKRIEDTIHPEYYKIGTFYGGTQPQFRGSKEVATFDLAFDCDPRKFLIGYDEYENLALDSYVLLGSENAGVYYNPIFLLKNIQKVECFYKNAESDPSYSVYGTIVSINGETTLYYDTETRYAYYGSSSRDLYIAQRSLATPVIPSHTYATYLKVTAISGAASPSASVATRKYTL